MMPNLSSSSPINTVKLPFNSVKHYENFPVASLLLPKHSVAAVQALYRFARAADDIADEGDAPADERLTILNDLQAQLTAPQHANTPLIKDLAPFIENGKMPVQYLQSLLTAFIQDVKQDAQNASNAAIRYANMNNLLAYCEHSANPVGRLMLHIIGTPSAICTPAALTASDSICTSLQLINFWQDLAKDALAERIYIPHDIFARHGSPKSPQDSGYIPMMQELCDDARQRMAKGLPLLALLRGRFKAEIALTMAGGLRILDKLAACNYDVIHHRPTLSWRDAPACLGTVWHLYRGRLK